MTAQTPPAFETIRYAVEDGIAITLHRPEKMNAFNPKMADDWHGEPAFE